MADSKYNIEISDADMTAFEDINNEATMPQEEVVSNDTTHQQTEETSQEATENRDVDANSANTFDIDGESYDLDTIRGWQEDSTNKESWQKSNTEKAQELAKWNKFAEKLDSDDSLKEHIKDYYFDDEDQIAKLGLDGKFPIIESEEPLEEQSELELRLHNLEEAEGERFMSNRVNELDGQLTSLEQANPSLLGDDKTDSFLEFLAENGETYIENEIPNLEKAFKVWSYDAMQNELTHLKKLDNNRSRNEGKIIGNSKKGVQETKTPNKHKSYRDISIDDPDVSRFFEN